MIATPEIDWLALAPTLALLGASGVALLGSVPVSYTHLTLPTTPYV